MDKTEEFLQHHGVKGMRWGIRRYQPYPKGEGHKGKFIKKIRKRASDSRVGQEIRSTKRTLEALKTRSKIDSMSTSELKTKTKRLRLENEMKRLSGKGTRMSSAARKASRKERKDYRNRSRMSDQEITRKLDRLRAKNALDQNASEAAKVYLDIGKRASQTVAALAVTLGTSGSISKEQVIDALFNPKTATGASVAKGMLKKHT